MACYRKPMIYAYSVHFDDGTVQAGNIEAASPALAREAAEKLAREIYPLSAILDVKLDEPAERTLH